MSETVKLAAEKKARRLEAALSVDFDLDELFMVADRRVELGKRMNKQKLSCPTCQARQIQLIGYMDVVPAKWKCRKCKCEFLWEGE